MNNPPPQLFCVHHYHDIYCIISPQLKKPLCFRIGATICFPFLAIQAHTQNIALLCGFPHSEIFGSKLSASSPKRIAGYRVLHRNRTTLYLGGLEYAKLSLDYVTSVSSMFRCLSTYGYF